MVRGLSVDGSASAPFAPRRARQHVDTTKLLGKIVSALRGFAPAVVEEGRVCLRGVSDFEWSPTRREFSIRVGSSSPDTDSSTHDVTVAIRSLALLEIKRVCTCRGHKVSGECAHGWAALYHLYSELSTRETELEIEDEAPEARTAQSVWTSRLVALDKIIGTDTPSETIDADSPTERTAWRVAVRRAPYFDIEISPYEQRAGANGRWSRGRKLTWSRWTRSPELWREPEDRAVAGIIRQIEAPDRVAFTAAAASGVDAFDILGHLVSHPRVFDADEPSRRLEVLSGKLAVSLRLEDDQRIRLVPNVDRVELTDGGAFRLYARGLVYVSRVEATVLVAPIDGSRRSLVEHLLEEDLSFPDEARDELLTRLPALEALFPVELPKALDSQRVPADERVHVLLRPIGAGGLSVSLRFRPLPGGTDWSPGEGLPTHGRVIEKRWVTAERDLARERKAAERLAQQLDLDARDSRKHAGESSAEALGWTWEIESIDHALALLRDLRRNGDDDTVIEWPEGEALTLLPQRLGPGSLRVQSNDKEDLFGLDGFVDLDGARVTLALLLERVRNGSRFVQVDDRRWAEISDVLHSRLELLSEVARDSGSGIAVSRAALPVVEEALDDCDFERSTSWSELAGRLSAKDDDAFSEPQINATLRPYQREGFEWMSRLASWGIGACLADDMGLGKTVQTLAVLSNRVDEGPTLVVAPTSVTANWVREAARFAPGLGTLLYRETDRKSRVPSFGRGDLVVVSYGLMRRDIERLARVDWGTIVLDEAQSIKNSRSQTARAVGTLSAGWRLALSGTPIENHLGELWSLFQFMTPGLLASWAEFRRRFAEPIEKHGDDMRRRALAKLTRPFILRRTKSEVLTELPPRTDVTLRARLSAGERALYEDARLSALASLGSKQKALAGHQDLRFDVLAALTKLRQIACHPKLAHPDLALPSAKLELFLELVEDLRRGGHRALVFSQFTKFLGLIRKELEARGFSLCYLDGSTPAKERMRQVDKFQGGEGDVFLISLKAGGTGLNLTAADYVIHMDPWWNPAVEDQATDRAHRLGQKRPVNVYRLVGESTIEEEIQKMQAVKRELIASVLDGSDGAASLSTADLVDLIRSSRDIAESPDDEPEPAE
jgi:superfamily II DNA or RNA helicase